MFPRNPLKEALEAVNNAAAARTRCRLLELPPEIREQIWLHAVTNWTPTKPGTLEKHPIRVDNLNRPLPPGLTRTNRQLASETLHLYYTHNTFECWRPIFSSPAWTCMSTLMFWLNSLGVEKVSWLTSVVLLYKRESELGELHADCHEALALEGFVLGGDVISFRQEQSEYELSYAQLGLPRQFGGREACRWMYRAD